MPSNPRDPRIPIHRYLGDGVYVESSGWDTCVNLTTTSEGIVTNRIVLKPDMLRALDDYLVELRAAVAEVMKERAETDA
jgi:hypothetical protein